MPELFPADEGDEEVERHIGEALRVLDERAEVGRQAAWVEAALWEPLVSPSRNFRSISWPALTRSNDAFNSPATAHAG